MRRASTIVERAALAYAARGLSVVPVEPSGKRPIVPWQAFQQRVASADEIAAWWRRRPPPNVAIVTGAVSGVIVVDVDPAHGGAASLAGLERDHGPLPPTVEATTGGGGRHLYFAAPGEVVRNRVGFAPGVDVRGEGGCVVAPPSLHASGRRYQWVRGRAPGELALAPLPGWLRGALRGGARGGHPLEHWRELVRGGARAGERNSAVASFAGHLLWHGVDPEVVLELLRAWNRDRCTPPLSDDEVARTVASIARLHERDEGGR